MTRFEIGDWQVRPDLNLIGRSGEERSLQPKVMEVLVYLAENAGELLHKERLIQAIWPDTFVTDDVLKQAIFQLRQAFDDDSKEPRYIQTIPKRGYCLIAEVHFPEEDQEAHPERYRLLQKIAEGGMAEIYLAEDTDLGRRVALKFLKQEKEEDEIGNRRFRREARAAAALDHPYICKVYETGILDRRSFIAMEYVEGETLKDRLRRGPRPLKEALRITREMAEALEAAHRHGIVHRDIKPSNLILTEQGHVKITDFGIAKRFRKEEGEPGDWTLTETVEETVGTPDYMSPEQIRGDPVDFRSDIFSFGIVLYEMVVGVHPFRRKKRAETTAAILQAEPGPLGEHSRTVPEPLEHIVKKMLAKDPERRSQSMRGVQNDLKQLAEDMGQTRRVEGSQVAPWFWKAAGAVTFLAILLVAFVYFFPPESGDRTLTAYEPIRLTSYPGYETSPSFSPNGSLIAYSSWDGQAGQPGRIWVKLVGEGDPIPLTDSQATDSYPSWSPDGRQIAFARAGSTGTSLRLIPALGGTARKLAELAPLIGPEWHMSSDWMPDGKWLVATSRKTDEPTYHLSLISAETGEVRPLTSPSEDTWGDTYPAVSPDGSMVAFARGPGPFWADIYLLSLSETLEPVGEPRRLTNQYLSVRGLTWTADGKSIIYSGAEGFFDSRLWITDIERGEPRRLHLPGDILKEPVASRRGDCLAYTESTLEMNIYSLKLFDRQVHPGSLRQIISSSRVDLHPQVSPDGTQLAFFSNRRGAPAAYISNVDGSEQVLLSPLSEGAPLWSPDGSQIVVVASSKGQAMADIYVVDVESGVHQRVNPGPTTEVIPRFSDDVSWLYFQGSSPSGQVVIRLNEEGESVHVTDGYAPALTPDGQYLYFKRGHGATESLWRMPVEGGKEEKLVNLSTQHFYQPVREGVFFTAPGENDKLLLQYLDPDSRKVTPCGQLPAGTATAVWDITPDGKAIFFSKVDRAGSDLMLVENFH